MVTASRKGHVVTRNSSFFKKGATPTHSAPAPLAHHRAAPCLNTRPSPALPSAAMETRPEDQPPEAAPDPAAAELQPAPQQDDMGGEAHAADMDGDMRGVTHEVDEGEGRPKVLDVLHPPPGIECPQTSFSLPRNIRLSSKPSEDIKGLSERRYPERN